MPSDESIRKSARRDRFARFNVNLTIPSPLVQRGGRHPVLAAQLQNAGPRFRVTQNPDDLLLRETLSLVLSSFPRPDGHPE